MAEGPEREKKKRESGQNPMLNGAQKNQNGKGQMKVVAI